jgi:putative sigma-54 modulation protein
VELIAHASHAIDASHVAEVTLLTNGSVIRSASAGPNPMAAIDTLLDKLERQVVRSKTRPRRVREREHDEARIVLVREADGSVATDAEADEAEETGPSVVRIKRFDMVPMFEEDAVTRMEELGHAFFVFLNAESERICVVYRRRDATYGLIEPMVGDGR